VLLEEEESITQRRKGRREEADRKSGGIGW
jgi:hypothetical protein